LSATVFIVVDDEAVRDSLNLLLMAAGHHTRTFASGSAFLSALAAGDSGVAVVDVRMPEMDGLMVQRRLNERGQHLPVVLITGHGDVPMAVAAMKAGAVDFVEKPFSDEAIIEAIGRALAQTTQYAGQADPVALQERLDALTPREREVLEAIVAGHANKMIAHKLAISPRTVEIHRARVMEKMQARNLSQLVRLALAAGVDPPAG
jgi:two-component system response regulator FixJ